MAVAASCRPMVAYRRRCPEHTGLFQIVQQHLESFLALAREEDWGAERLLRYCAHPPFTLERLELIDGERVIDRLSKPLRDGTTVLTLTPLEFIDHLAARPESDNGHLHGVIA